MKADNGDKKEFVLPVRSTVQSEKTSQNIFFESNGEHVLPDYMPKVEKLLRAESKVLPPSRYMAGGETQMSGNILHSLIYVGDEGEISATVLPSKYEFSVPYEDGAVLTSIIASPIIDSANCRPSAPRKINVRSKLRAQPRASYEEDITPMLPSDDGLHMLCGEIDTVTMKVLRAENVSVSENVEIEAPDEARLIWCGANAAVTDVRVSEGGVQVRGDIYVKLLSVNGSEARMHTKKIPFEEYLDGELSRKAMATASACVISTEASREQSGEALVDITLSIEAVVCVPSKSETVFDAFSEKADASVEYRKVTAARLLLCRSGVYNLGGSMPKNVLSGYSDMLDATGTAAVEEVTSENGKITVNGRSNLQFIYKTAEGTFASAEHALPFKIVLDCETPSGVDTSANAELVSVRTRSDGENIICDMEIALCLRAIERRECETVKSIDTAGAKAYAKSEYPLCLIYPQGESLWSLAKKYRVSPEKLAKVNSLSVEKGKYTSPEAIAGSKILMLQF